MSASEPRGSARVKSRAPPRSIAASTLALLPLLHSIHFCTYVCLDKVPLLTRLHHSLHNSIPGSCPGEICIGPGTLLRIQAVAWKRACRLRAAKRDTSPRTTNYTLWPTFPIVLESTYLHSGICSTHQRSCRFSWSSQSLTQHPELRKTAILDIPPYIATALMVLTASAPVSLLLSSLQK